MSRISKYGQLHHEGPSLELTTMIGCPLMCTFCPQKSLKDNYGESIKYMRLEGLRLALSKLPRNTRIDFSGMSEPWANPECTSFLEEVLFQGFKVAIYTTLWGMKPEDALRVSNILKNNDHLVEAFVIHLPDEKNNMKGWRFSDEWSASFEIISRLKLSCGIKMMTMDKGGNIHPSVVALTNSGVKLATTIDFDPISRAGSLISDDVEVSTPKNSFSLVCRSTPFYDRNVMLPNGDIVLCCMDYELKHILGNLFNMEYADLFESEELLNVIHLNEKSGFDKCTICKSCENVVKIE